MSDQEIVANMARVWRAILPAALRHKECAWRPIIIRTI